MHPFLRQISELLNFLPEEKREAEAWRLIYNVFGFTELDFQFIRTVEPNRREKKQMREYILKLQETESAKKTKESRVPRESRVSIASRESRVSRESTASISKKFILTAFIINHIIKYENKNLCCLHDGTFAYDCLSQT